jgi:hypothetical protein
MSLFSPFLYRVTSRNIVKLLRNNSHHAPNELVQPPLEEFVSDAGASLVFDWCKRVFDDYSLIILAVPSLMNVAE